MKKLILAFIIALSSLLMGSSETMETNHIIEGNSKKPSSTLDLTVRKITSKELVAIVDETKQEITVEIKDMGEIVVFETLDEFSKVTVEGKGNNFSKVLNINNDLNQGKEVVEGNYKYNLYTFDNLRVLQINYTLYPKDLYVGILDNQKNVQSVYKLDLVLGESTKEEPTLIVDQPSDMVFNVTANRNSRSSIIEDYTAETIVTFQTSYWGLVVPLNADVIVPERSRIITLTEVNSSKPESELETLEVEILTPEPDPLSSNESHSTGVAYKIVGKISGEDIARIPGALSDEGIDMKFAGKLIIQILIQ